ncbi:Snf3p [Sugiyamaella lignohabitans]|uniref:Snf3p n=1 Tax=Sugiyamaella lignohabitans TaxID=796027 RepID=A0A167CY60_9ASCO|nr:Snf3p [Sugiyamaella lignohabitans]ANB12246.1 Snf3p [Sugiyamaella lignohabitans]
MSSCAVPLLHSVVLCTVMTKVFSVCSIYQQVLALLQTRLMTRLHALMISCMQGHLQRIHKLTNPPGSVLVMQNFQAHFPRVTDKNSSNIQGWLVSCLELGAWFGALFCGWLSDKISRKYAMMVGVIIFTLGTGFQVGAQNEGFLFAGRTIGGIGIGMFSMVIPLYQSEIAPPELRGSLVSLQQQSITIGTCISFWLDYGFHFIGGPDCRPNGVNVSDADWDPDVYGGQHCEGEKTVSWRVPLAIQIIPAWILFFGMFFLPFSPRWLVMKDRDEEAKASLSKLRRLPEDDPLLVAEFLEIKSTVMFDREVRSESVTNNGWLAPWKELFSPNIFRRVMIGVWIMIFQQFTGINAILYYSPQIFATFGFSSVTIDLLATGVTGCLQVLCTLPAVLFLDKFGRRSFMIVGALGMFICHIVVAGVEGSFENNWPAHRAGGWVAIVFIWLFAVNFAYSWGPVAWVLTQELFPSSFRSRGVSIVASVNWMFNFIIGLTTKDMLNSMKYGTYIFFGAFCLMGAGFMYWFVPETKDKTLEELDVYFGGTSDSLAAADRERMQRIMHELGMDNYDDSNDLKEKADLTAEIENVDHQ